MPGVLASMEGRAIARPNQYRALEDTGPTYSLQWRAEQLLGQTVRGVCEGRSPHFSFNGGPSNCSAKLGRLVEGVLDRMGASMEGRAIARPNRETPPALEPSGHGFNGGPSNCSAKHGIDNRCSYGHYCFNGGPSNCSAKLDGIQLYVYPPCELQWRAEQLLGQTRSRAVHGRLHLVASMEGRAIARPNQPVPLRYKHLNQASMEGRAIARPNWGVTQPCYRTKRGLQWRAEQLLGQTSSMPGRLSSMPGGLQWRAEQLLGQTR